MCPSHSPREMAPIPLRHARPILPSPGPAPARDRSSPRLCTTESQTTLAQGWDSHVEARRADTTVYVAPHAQLPVQPAATAESPARYTHASAVSPPAFCHILGLYLSGPVAPLACAHAYMQSLVHLNLLRANCLEFLSSF